jgi:hypothetical protein
MSFTNQFLAPTIVHPLFEAQVKGGQVDVLRPGMFDEELVKLGKRIFRNKETLEKDVDVL